MNRTNVPSRTSLSQADQRRPTRKLLALLALVAGCAGTAEQVKPTAAVCPDVTKTAPVEVAPQAPLGRELFADRVEKVVLEGGASDDYWIRLNAGEYVKLQVMQRGIDVVLTSFAPDGKKLKEVDSPNGTNGPEFIEIVAETAGIHRVVVGSPDGKVEPGRYEMAVSTKLTADEYRKYSIVELDAKTLAALAGAYEIAPNRRLFLGIGDEIGLQLVAVDSQTRRFGLLQAHSPTELFMGASLIEAFPVATEYSFKKAPSGEITGVEVREGNGAPVFARRVAPARSEEVSFKSGGLTLKGTLLLPEGKGPHPAIVYAHGSGARTRHVMYFTTYLAQLGFAVYSFDKRGVGESEGDWRTAGFDELAKDVVAGVEMLGKRPDIDPARVGVWGISQGGWIGSLAAQSPSVKFLLSVVGSGVSVWENVVHETETQMRDAGVSGPDLEQGVAFAKRIFKMAADGASFEDVQAVVKEHRGKGYVDFVWMARIPKDSPWWIWFKRNGHVDPSQVLPKVRCPVLWMLADRDSQVPTEASEPRIRAAFQKGKNKDFTLQVIPWASHAMIECTSCLMSEAPKWKYLAPGYLDTMSTWLRRQAKLP